MHANIDVELTVLRLIGGASLSDRALVQEAGRQKERRLQSDRDGPFSPAFCPIATTMALQTRQKLSLPGSLFASTPSVAQTLGENFLRI